MRHAKRVDRNHAEVKAALKLAGWQVTDLSHIGHGVPDLFAIKPREDRAEFIEVKDGTKAPSARKLTEDEVFWHEILKRAGIAVKVIERVEQIAEL